MSSSAIAVYPLTSSISASPPNQSPGPSVASAYFGVTSFTCPFTMNSSDALAESPDLMISVSRWMYAGEKYSLASFRTCARIGSIRPRLFTSKRSSVF